MDASFWLERWRLGQTGFHQATPHAALERHWSSLGCAPEARVFVPLAGKSLDLLWLRGRQAAVVGVELSEIAVRDFFRENGIDASSEPAGAFARYRGGGIELLCGDFFALDRAQLGEFRAVFDRASLIALPPEMRPGYAEHMTALCAPGTETLLVTLEYEQARMAGPPFSVPEDEVRALYGATHAIRPLERTTPPDFARFASRGLTWMNEVVYRLTRR